MTSISGLHTVVYCAQRIFLPDFKMLYFFQFRLLAMIFHIIRCRKVVIKYAEL